MGYGPEYEVLQLVMSMLGQLLLVMLMEIAASVFLALCVYNDARARGSDSAVLWAVLSAFFNFVALIYVIVQAVSKPKPVYCYRCGNFVPAGFPSCPVCFAPIAGRAMPAPEEMAVHKKRRTIFLVLFITFYVLAIIAGVLMAIHFLSEVMDLTYEYAYYY